MFAEFDKVVHCLALELPEPVHADVVAKYGKLKLEVEKLTTTNIDYAAALKACDLFAKEGTGEVSMPMFTQFCKERLNSSTNCA